MLDAKPLCRPSWYQRHHLVAAWHQAPVREGRDLLRLHWQITSVRRAPGKLKYLAGSESSMGAFIMDLRPEQSAAQLREVKLK